MLVDNNTAVMSSSKAPEMMYQYHEAKDIHEIHLINATKPTMEEFFQLISRLYYAAPTSGITRIMIRQTGPALPLNHFMADMRTFISQHRKMPQSAPARFAIVLELTPFLQLIRQLLRLMRHQDAVTFFDHKDDAKALTWLQS